MEINPEIAKISEKQRENFLSQANPKRLSSNIHHLEAKSTTWIRK
jgi:hypothetical protein